MIRTIKVAFGSGATGPTGPTGATGPSGGGGSGPRLTIVDLVVDLNDAVLLGRNNILIPYADGRLITDIKFVPPAVITEEGSHHGPYFFTPNTAAEYAGFGFLDDVTSLSDAKDTRGLFYSSLCTDLQGTTQTSNAQIADCGPMVAMQWTANDNTDLGVGTWQAETPYCYGDAVLANGYVQVVQGGEPNFHSGGVSGSTEPTWDDTPGNNTTDGSIVWINQGLPPEGSIHVIATVIEGVSPMPLYPASIEFVVPPANTVAGETMADITVLVKDQNGDPYSGGAPTVELDLLGAGTLNGSQQGSDPDTGIATLSGYSITEPGTGYIIRAKLWPSIVADPIFSPPFDVT